MPSGVHKQIRKFVEWIHEGITRITNGAKTMPKGHQNGPILIQNDEKRSQTASWGCHRGGFENSLPKEHQSQEKLLILEPFKITGGR